MSLDNVAAEDFASANTTVVGSLRCWVATLGPAIWPAIWAKDGVFLLQTKPWLVLGIGLHQPHRLMTVVVLVGGSIGIPRLSHDQDVVATSERIGKNCNRADVDVGVVARRLTGGRTVEIPFRQFLV